MSPSIRRPFMGSAFSPTTAWIKSLETTGGVGVGKEEGGIFVEFRRRAPEHLTQVGGKVLSRIRPAGTSWRGRHGS